MGGNLFIGSGAEVQGINKFYGDGRYNLDGLGSLTVAQHVVLGVVSGTFGELNINSAGKPGAVFIVSAADSATALTVGSAGSGAFNQFAGSATLKSFNSATPALVRSDLERQRLRRHQRRHVRRRRRQPRRPRPGRSSSATPDPAAMSKSAAR